MLDARRQETFCLKEKGLSGSKLIADMEEHGLKQLELIFFFPPRKAIELIKVTVTTKILFANNFQHQKSWQEKMRTCCQKPPENLEIFFPNGGQCDLRFCYFSAVKNEMSYQKNYC